MIPVGLAAAHAAFHAWRNSLDPNGPTPLGQLGDDDLADAYRVLSSLAKDVEDAHSAVRDVLVRRLMATNKAAGRA